MINKYSPCFVHSQSTIFMYMCTASQKPKLMRIVTLVSRLIRCIQVTLNNYVNVSYKNYYTKQLEYGTTNLDSWIVHSYYGDRPMADHVALSMADHVDYRTHKHVAV